MIDAFRLVYRHTWSIVLAIVAFTMMALFYLWSSQVLVISGSSVSFAPAPEFVVVAFIMSLLFGLVVPLMVYAARVAATTAAQAGGTALGAIFGTVSMTCCAPVILPALLSLLGFSGTTVLRLNQTLNRFWLPLAVAGIILLSYSLISVLQTLDLQCSLNNQTSGGGTEGFGRELVGETVAELN